MSQTIVQGEYYFHKMEMASGFNFSADGKFQFFYSYGAVDRSAEGSFTVSGDTLKLKSTKEGGKDFAVSDQSIKGNSYHLSFHHPNKYLLKNILCVFVVNGKQHQEFTDENGEVKANITYCDTIYAIHTLYPDVATIIKDKENKNNVFTLNLNSSLEQVSFKGIDLTIVDAKTLACPNNYFIEATDIKFIKQ